MTAPAFWELSVTGSDLFAIGVLFVVRTRLVWAGRTGAGVSVAEAVLVFAAASARASFAWVTMCLSLFMYRQRRAGAALVSGVTVATVAFEAWFWLPRSDGTPLYLVSKRSGLLGITGVILAVAVAVSASVWAIGLLNERIETWWLGLWVMLAVPLATVSISVLAALGREISNWPAAGYLEAAVPALVAYVAMPPSRNAP
jgi:hypothetical protein